MKNRGTSNSNVRGSSRDRRGRKIWLLKTYASDVPAELYCSEASDVLPYCRCYRCGHLLTFDTVTVDRIIPGCHGGKYIRSNIRPACGDCNSETGGRLRARNTDMTGK